MRLSREKLTSFFKQVPNNKTTFGPITNNSEVKPPQY